MGKIKKLTDNIFIWIANWIKDHFVQKDNTEEVLETDLQEVELANVAISGSYNDLIDKPTMSEEYVTKDYVDVQIGNIEQLLQEI